MMEALVHTQTQMPNSPTGSATKRLVSLDVFRGITIAGMVLVNNPGTLGTYLLAASACQLARLDADGFSFSLLPFYSRCSNYSGLWESR